MKHVTCKPENIHRGMKIKLFRSKSTPPGARLATSQLSTCDTLIKLALKYSQNLLNRYNDFGTYWNWQLVNCVHEINNLNMNNDEILMNDHEKNI